jgi:putative peptidoglycan lipid II flippase
VQLASRLRRLQGTALLNSLIVMGGFALSRLSGLLRDVLIAAQFGANSAELGAYVSAFRIVDLLYIVIIGGALGSSFIPVFIQAWERESEERAWALASAMLTWTLLILTGASAILFLAAPFVTRIAFGGPDYSAATLTLITQLTRLFLLSPLLLGLGGLAMAALNARDRFALPALAPTIYNLGIIGGAMLAPRFGIWGLAWGVVGGALAYLLVQIPGLLAIGMRLRPQLGRGMAELRSVATAMGPRILGQSAAHFSTLVTAALTARLLLGDERQAGLNFAYQLMLLPYGIFALSLSQVAFPTLSRLYVEGRREELISRVQRTTALILVFTLPAAVALATLGVPLVRLIYQRGAFDATSLLYTVQPLLPYATALPAFAVSEIMIRTLYALQRIWLPVVAGLIQVSLNLGLGIVLLAGGDTRGLVFAFSIANNVEALLLVLALALVLPGIWHSRALLRDLIAAVAGSLALLAALLGLQAAFAVQLPFLRLDGAYNWPADLPALVGYLAGAALSGIGIYLGVLWLLRAPSLRLVVGRLRREQNAP